MQLNFDNAELYDFVNQIADTLGITPIIIDPNVKGSVNIHSSAPLAKDDVFPLFNLILKTNNSALVKQGNIYQLVPISEALRKGLEIIDHRPPESPVKPEGPPPAGKGTVPSQPPQDGGSSALNSPQPQTPAPATPASAAAQAGAQPAAPKLSTHVLRAEFVSVKDLIEPLKLFMTEGGVIMPYERLNMLIVTDYTDNVQKIMEIIRLLDDAFINPELVELVGVKYNSSADIADDLRKIFGSGTISRVLPLMSIIVPMPQLGWHPHFTLPHCASGPCRMSIRSENGPVEDSGNQSRIGSVIPSCVFRS